MTNVIYWPKEPNPQDKVNVAWLLGYRMTYCGPRKRHWRVIAPNGAKLRREETQAKAWETAWAHIEACGGRGNWRLPYR